MNEFIRIRGFQSEMSKYDTQNKKDDRKTDWKTYNRYIMWIFW